MIRAISLRVALVLMAGTPFVTAQDVIAELVKAIERNDLAKVQQLASKTPNLNVFWSDENQNRKTPLMIAADKGYLTITKFLLERGANPNLYPSDQGAPAVLLASNNGHKEIVALLIEGGANPNAANRFGATALLAAADKGHRDIVELLVKHGADTSATLFSGDTALIIAAKGGYKEIADFLCKTEGAACNRADVNRIIEQSRQDRTLISGKLLEKSETWIRVDSLGDVYKFPIQAQTKILDQHGEPIPVLLLNVGEIVTVAVHSDQVMEIKKGGLELRPVR